MHNRRVYCRTGHNNMPKKYTKVIPYTSMMNVAKIIATKINSNKFTDFDLIE